MSFETATVKQEERRGYSALEEEDKKKILEFERKVGSMDIEEYCASLGLTVKNEKYKLGAIIPFYVNEYKDIKMLWSGLHELKHYREKARARERAQAESLRTANLVDQMRLKR